MESEEYTNSDRYDDAAFWATVFNSGLISPGWAGTCGSLIIFALQIIIMLTRTNPLPKSVFLGLFLPIVSFLAGVAVIPDAIHYLRNKYGKQRRHNGEITDIDYNQINIDEAHGMAVAGVPIFFLQPAHWFIWLTVALILFRIFDIWKHPGIKTFERKMSKKYEILTWQALVIMLDDTIAGLYAAICVLAGIYFFN